MTPTQSIPTGRSRGPVLSNLLRLLFVATSLLAGSAGTLSAQTAPTASPPAATEEVLQLSPFEVRTDADKGYTATSSLAGGRTDSPLKLTSSAISVMTAQFIEDIGATNFRSAGEWALNYVPDPEVNTGPRTGFANNYRNMGSGFASRNYFLYYVEADSYNTERFEFARGPNGVLFGDSGAGGMSTTWTKRPRFDRSTNSVTARADSYGGYRSTVDLNRPITKDFALRLNAFYDAGQSWRDSTDNTRKGAHLAGNVRLTPRNHFRFEGEYGLQRRILYPNYYTDQGSFWDRNTSFDGATAPAAAAATLAGIGRISTSNYFVFLPGTANNGLNDWGPYYQSLGTGLSLLPTGAARADMPNSPRLPNKEFNFQPPDSIVRVKHYTWTVYFDHRFSENLFVEVAYNRLRDDREAYGSQSLFSTYRIDVNRTLPGGGANPNYGKPFTDNERILSSGGNTVWDARALVNWRFEKTWGKQSFSFIGGVRPDVYDFYQRSLRRINGTSPNLTAAANFVRERRYWDQTGVSLGGTPVIPGVTLDWIPTSISHQKKTLKYLQVASSTRFFSDRLAVSLGVRRDAVTNEQLTTSGIPADPITGLPQLGAVLATPGSAKAPVAVIGAKSVGKFSPVSRNIGAVYFLRPWLGVFANFSETFAPPNNGPNLINGSPTEVSVSKGQDFGFKLELLDGKISGTISRYTSQQVGLLINGSYTTEINRIWTNLGRADLASLSFMDTQDQKGDGYELDLTANLTRNLRLNFNLALPETSSVNLQPGLVGYFNANLAAWQAVATGSLNPAQVNTDINTIRNAISSLTPGTPLNNTYKYTGNIYATYTIPGGTLKNLAFGGGANLRGKSKIASVLNQPYDYLYADNYVVVAAHATYRHRFSQKLNARFQLNISNLLDSDKPIYNSFSTYRVGGLAANPLVQVPGTIRMPEPRKFTLTTTLDF